MVRAAAIVLGLLLVAIGAGLGFALGLVGFGLIGVAVAICGLAMMALNNRFGSRTANGSAVLAQAKGFELYLTTAEADQIKFEEGIDIFSRYLPYAIVFGVADRWTKIFEQLAAQGRYVADNSWYLGYGYGTFFSSGFTSSLDQLASTMSTSMQASTVPSDQRAARDSAAAAVSAVVAAAAGDPGRSGTHSVSKNRSVRSVVGSSSGEGWVT